MRNSKSNSNPNKQSVGNNFYLCCMKYMKKPRFHLTPSPQSPALGHFVILVLVPLGEGYLVNKVNMQLSCLENWGKKFVVAAVFGLFCFYLPVNEKNF